MRFNKLPVETQAKVKDVLCAYDTCTVEQNKNTKEYYVTTSTLLTNEYTRKFVMKVNKNDVFTKEEQIVNYVNEFKSYPLEYKGTRDYNKLQLLDNNYKAILVNGNIDIVKKEV